MASNLDFREFPLIKSLREKGLKTTVAETLDDVVFRLTPGINIGELRGMLRGDPPGRPNPRLRPHADGAILHMRPGYYNELVTGLYPTFRLGWLSVYFFLLETLTGIFLMVFYAPSGRTAYHDMLTILSNVPFGQFTRDLHRLGAEAMVIIVAAHMLRTFLTASYKRPRGFTWATGVLLLFFTLGLSYTGYLLPWDQLAYWAVTIGASMIEATPPPIVGEFANILVKGAPDLGASGLLRFYLLHVIGFPVLLLTFLFVHYYKVIVHGHSLPPENEKTGEDNAKRVPVERRVYYLPDLLVGDLYLAGLTTLIMMIAVLWFYHAPLENHSNTLNTPLHTVAPWYFLWIQGMLKLGDKTLMGVIIPMGILIPAFIFMPYVDVGKLRFYARRRVAWSLAMLFMSFIAVTSWMGTPAFLVQTSKDQEILFELAPPEQPGPVRIIPYDELPIGAYEVMKQPADWKIPQSSPLFDLMKEFQSMIVHARNIDPKLGGLPNAEAFVVINEIQPHLKTVVLRITWDNPNKPGEKLSNEAYIPVHAEAYAGGGE
jgi:quinol-cytochrome oxidoreductase complex cytochrome b subunit